MTTKQKTYGKKVSRESADVLAEKMEELRRLFPAAFTEGKMDWEKLRAILGGEVDDRAERYSFSWAGKRDAIRLLQTPSRATLVPAKDESVDFDATQNLFIEGDNLEVLKLLYKPYFGRVKMIYIDPPYNTGNDFIYPDNFADPLDTYLRLTGQKSAEGNLLTSNPETSGRYHSAWLSMMYPRLFLAKQLLQEEGLIFITIDDNELANLLMLLNEIFGEENRVAVVSWEKRFTRSNNARLFASVKDSVVVYRNNPSLSYLREARTEKSDSIYDNPDNDPRGPWTSVSYVNPATKAERPNLVYPIVNPITKEKVIHPTNAWKFSREQNEIHTAERRLYWGKEGNFKYPRLKKFLSEVSDGMVPVDLWHHKESGTTDEGSKELAELVGKDVFDNPKPTRLLRRMIKIGTEKNAGEVILDFFGGSCTTAHAVLEQNREDGGNRRFIMVQLPEPTTNKKFPTIAEIGKERIRRVIAKLRKEKAGELDLKARETPEDLGFKVFKLAESNYRPWTGVEGKDAEKYGETMELYADPLVGKWKTENVIYEVAIKEGYGLNCRIEKCKEVKGNTVWRVTDPDKEQRFYICLDDEVNAKALRALELKRDDLFVCRDVALNDRTAANLALQCHLKTL